jgi:hypothetical protein
MNVYLWASRALDALVKIKQKSQVRFKPFQRFAAAETSKHLVLTTRLISH